MLCPNKEFNCKSSGKLREKFRTDSQLKHVEVLISKSPAQNKQAMKISHLKDEANSNWELVRNRKMKRDNSHLCSRTHTPAVPVAATDVGVESRESSQGIRIELSPIKKKENTSTPQLHSPSRTKLRMAPSIDLPLLTVGSYECEVINSPKKAKMSLRTSSRSNKGINQKYFFDSFPSNTDDRHSIFPEQTSDKYSLQQKSELVAGLLKSAKKLEKRKNENKRAKNFQKNRLSCSEKTHDSFNAEGTSKYNHRIKYISYNIASNNSKISLSPKLKSPTKLESPHFSMDISSQSPLTRRTGSQGEVVISEITEIPVTPDDKLLKTNDVATNEMDEIPTDVDSPVSDVESEESESEPPAQIETGMVGVYLEASYPQLPPLCSLCCSAGDHELIFCSLCCDPYHRFCVGLESELNAIREWICYSCISCAVCGRGRDVETIHQCFKCQTYYHMGCLGIHPLPHSDTNASNWPCPICLVCTACGMERPEKFPRRISSGKLLCKRCEKLTRKGNFCPICGKVYGDNDWDCKMVECDICKSWLHSTCESLSDEEYNLLGDLPPTIPYICSICHKSSELSSQVVPWRRAIGENRNLRIQIIMSDLQSSSACKMCLKELGGSTNGMKSLHTTLLAILLRVEDSSYSSLEEFCIEWLNSLQPIFKLAERKTNLYRNTFAIQNSFIKLMCKEFPWFLIPKVGHSVNKNPPKLDQLPAPPQSCFGISSTEFFNPASDLHPVYTLDHSYSKPRTGSPDRNRRNGKRKIIFSSPDKHKPTDRRQCILCKDIGDVTGKKEGRLLPCGINEWVHTNCAIWSSDVYTKGSCLKNVDAAILTGLKTYCGVCSLLGATIGCYDRLCLQSVHYSCGRRSEWGFMKNRKVYCPQHGNQFTSQLMCDDDDFLVNEFLFVESSSASQNRRLQNMAKLTGSRKLNIVSGCVRVYSLGSLIPSSDTEEALYPINFRSSRLFWSVRDPTLLSSYTCFVKEHIPEEPIYHPNINYTISHNDTSPDENVRHLYSSLQPTRIDDGVSPRIHDSNNEPMIHSQSSTTPLDSPVHCQIDIPNSNCNISDSPVKVRLSLDLSLGSETCSTDTLSVKGFFEQTFPFLKQTYYPIATSRKPIEYTKLSSSKLFPLINEDYFLSRHRSWLNESVTDLQDKPQHQQRSSQQQTSKLKFIIASSDGFTAQSESLQGAWDTVIHELNVSREANSLASLSYHTTCPQDMFGFTLHCITQEIERLEDTQKCSKYKFKFHTPSVREDWRDLEEVYDNLLGAARCIPYKQKSSHGMFNFFYSKHRCPPPKLDKSRLANILNEEEQLLESLYHTPHLLEVGNLPFIRYRQMIKNLSHTVKVFRSRIHGLGLFALRDIESGDMIIEYSGLVIRPLMCDIKEAYYESKGIGCYMFKIDENQVVDATMCGNASRFINHSCLPNCTSKIVVIEGKKKILIFARRKVIVGEELTYDYKFPLEENKLLCMCGSKKCRKYLN